MFLPLPYFVIKEASMGNYWEMAILVSYGLDVAGIFSVTFTQKQQKRVFAAFILFKSVASNFFIRNKHDPLVHCLLEVAIGSRADRRSDDMFV